MHLCYFDENKPDFKQNRKYFCIGGVIIQDSTLNTLDNALSSLASSFFGSHKLTTQNEFHGKDLFHGKGNSKQKPIKDRISIFLDITNLILQYKIPIYIVKIDIQKHNQKYLYPEPVYSLGLMLILERFCDHLDRVNDLGVVFGDYEKDEVTKAVVDFSDFKFNGKTPMYFGRPLGRLVDTIYFTQSHHSRFLQVADLLIFMAARYGSVTTCPTKWHEKEMWNCWQKIKASGLLRIQAWP